MKPLQRLKEGKFNDMSQVRQPDGSVIVTLVDNKKGRTYKFRVRDLYGPNEEVLNVATGKPIAKRDLR
ncbi:hypothetical protein ES708_12765 [subsurface metagenome]